MQGIRNHFFKKTTVDQLSSIIQSFIQCWEPVQYDEYVEVRGHLAGMGSLLPCRSPGYRTQFVRLGSKCFHSLSHLTSFFFETGSQVVQACLELLISLPLPSKCWITAVCHYIWLVIQLFNYDKIQKRLIKKHNIGFQRWFSD